MLTNYPVRGLAIVLLVLAVVVGPCHMSLSRSKRFLIYPESSPTRVQLVVGVGLPVDLDVESLTVGYAFKAEYFLPFNASELYEGIAEPFLPHPIQAEGRRKREVIEPNQYPNEKNVERYSVEAKVIQEESEQNNPHEIVPGNQESHWYDSENEEDPENNGYTLDDLKIKSPQDLSHSRFTIYRALETLARSSGMPGRPCLLRSICETAEAPFSYSNGILGELAHLIMTPSSSVDELSEHSDNEYLKAEQLGVSGAPCEQIFKECPISLLSKFSGIYETLKLFG